MRVSILMTEFSFLDELTL